MKKNSTSPRLVRSNLRHVLESREIKPLDAARLCGLSVPTIYDVMNNKSSPSLKTLGMLATGLQVTHAELLETYAVDIPKGPGD